MRMVDAKVNGSDGFIEIFVAKENDTDSMIFPSLEYLKFKFNGMEAEKHYTLEELGL